MGIFLCITAFQAPKQEVMPITSTRTELSAAASTTTQDTMSSPTTGRIKTIIFDLGGVLFKTSKRKQISNFLPLILKNPSLLRFKAEKEFFTVLHTIPATSILPIYNKGQKLPLIMSDWMAGLKTPQEIKLLTDKAITNSNLSIAQKKMLHKISELMFVPKNFANSQKPIKSMVNILQKLKKAGYQICILSNWDEHSFKYIHDKHPKIFTLSDKTVISGKEKLTKPNPAFFKKLLAAHNLNPAECIFIDDEIHNTKQAQKLGIKAIIHKNKNKTYKELMNNEIL